MAETGVWILLFSSITAIITGYFTFRISIRRLSGNVRTTDADHLWAYSEKLLGAYQEANATLRAEVVAQAARLWELSQKMGILQERERDCLHVQQNQTRKIERLERMLKIDIPFADSGGADLNAELDLQDGLDDENPGN